MRTGRTARRGSALVAAVIAGVLLAACGDDDDSSSSDDTAAPVEAPADTATDDTTAPADTGTGDIAAPTEAPADTATVGTGENAELCALATEMFSQESPPTADQLTQYQALAPDEISDAVATAAPPLIAAGEDVVAFYNAYAEDDVEAAVNEINLWENENCGLEHDDTTEVPEGASREVEDGAAQIGVVATDFAFDAPATIEAGRTSFVLTNEGDEAHFLAIAKLAEGVDLQTAMESEDDSAITGFWSTGIAATGGDDDEVITFDLEPGNYGMVCFVPAADGTPHAFMGMQAEFTIG